ncbi:MAG: ribonuclease III [Gammaproteobacteria bacterium]
MSDLLKQLETVLNYHFRDRKLLLQALSHRSTGSNNNERLEFLGDSLLNAVISAQLFESHSKLEEGALTRMRASLVNQGTLASIACDLTLGQFLLLGAGELKSGGQRRASILADTLEAVLGAIYVDGGFENVRAAIIKLFSTRLATPIPQENLKDCKTRLQETLQARDLPLPKYTIESVSGDAHQQVFKVSCSVEPLGIIAYGVAKNRRTAEQEAARGVLELLPDV